MKGKELMVKSIFTIVLRVPADFEVSVADNDQLIALLEQRMNQEIKTGDYNTLGEWDMNVSLEPEVIEVDEFDLGEWDTDAE